ncbi:MAG: ORF6N domain-containing protein [Steroidobacteraceae bacterium]
MRKSVAPEQIASAIVILRGQRVLQDSELAALYGVTTKRFNQQVRRNRKRFPADFMFQLTAEETGSLRSQFATLKTSGGQRRTYSPYVEETSSLRSQIATLKTGRGRHRKYLPYVFTEHGAIMAATILNSTRAIDMSVYVVRAFVQLREMLASNKELARRFAQLESRLDKKLTTHDEAIAAILSAIRELMRPPAPKGRPIGFTADLREKV